MPNNFDVTQYVLTPKHAHVLQWNPLRGTPNWFPLCDSAQVLAYITNDTIRDVANNGLPLVPWCATCVRLTRETVDRLTHDVLR
jgi:hypothetical protein